jgi:hypothetical protein
MKKLLFSGILAFFFLLFSTNISIANDFSFRLSANQKALDSEFIGLFEVSDSKLMGSICGVYDTDDYKILFLNAIIQDEIFFDGFTGGLGLRGAWGEAEKRYIDGDILNLGFVCYASYDLSKTTLNQFPITFSSSFCLSPEPLSFLDTTEFIEVLAECSWKVLDHAALVANYRYIKIDFEKQTKFEKSDNTGYMGLKFYF